jgi:predicted TIM-barrel fold metal-dependent hydrolase
MVIDFHVHPVNFRWVSDGYRNLLLQSYSEAELDRLFRELATAEALSAFLRAQGVDRAVVLAEEAPVTTGVLDNETLLELCRGQDFLIPFGTVNPHLVRDLKVRVRELERQGIRGLKLYPTYNHFYPNETRLYPLYEAAAELGLPVMFHTGSSVFPGSRLKYGDPIFFDDVAVDFPELKVVLCHAGRPFWTDKAEFLARLHPNVYLDLAGLPPKHLLRYLPNLGRIADKVVFGSDWPGVRTLKENIEEIRRLPLPEGAADAILSGTALRLLGEAPDRRD